MSIYLKRNMKVECALIQICNANIGKIFEMEAWKNWNSQEISNFFPLSLVSMWLYEICCRNMQELLLYCIGSSKKTHLQSSEIKTRTYACSSLHDRVRQSSRNEHTHCKKVDLSYKIFSHPQKHHNLSSQQKWTSLHDVFQWKFLFWRYETDSWSST